MGMWTTHCQYSTLPSSRRIQYKMKRHTQLDNEANGAHGDETHGNSLGNLDEFLAVSCPYAPS